MKRYKLKIDFKLGDISYTKDQIVTSKNTIYDSIIMKDNPHMFELLKPIFYTEDFKDGSFPKESCNNCDLRPSTECGHQGECSTVNSNHQYSNWQGDPQGEPIYEDEECWMIWKEGVDIHAFAECFKDVYTGINTDPTTKFFSDATNAIEYYNYLKWKDSLQLEIGDILINRGGNYKIKSKIIELDYVKEYCKLNDGRSIHFTNLHLFRKYENTSLKLNDEKVTFKDIPKVLEILKTILEDEDKL